MRALLEQLQGERIYLFTTQGHIYAGLLSTVGDEVVELIAANGSTRLAIAISDISGVRAYDEEPEIRL